MERLPLTLLLCLCLAPVLKGQLVVPVNLIGIPFSVPPAAGCCQRSEEITQTIGTDPDCTVKIRGCELACSRGSNHTGSILIGNTAADAKPVCPAEIAMEPPVCCKPARTVRRHAWCKGIQYSYEYPITCACGACEHLTTNPKCKLHEHTAKLSFFKDWQYCTSVSEITRRTCRGYCTSSEHNYYVYVSTPFPHMISNSRKSCQCCEAASYEVLPDVVFICSSPWAKDKPWDWFWQYTTDVQVILTCDCGHCGSKPHGVQVLEDEIASGAEPVDFTATLATLGRSIVIDTTTRP